MFRSRTLNNKINRLHEKALTLAYRNKTSLSFEDLLKKNETVNVHQRNLQILATEIYKAENDLAPDIMRDISYFILSYILYYLVLSYISYLILP